jgi:CRISPR/Cas system-associated exonuclease Cas4 (RecB family)
MNNKYSYSRLTTYIQCPRKHYYNYIEKVKVPDSPSALPGTLFHKCCELYLKGEPLEKLEEIFLEWDALSAEGKINKRAGLLKYIFTAYIGYYKREFEEETNILTEYKFEDILNDTDVPEEQDIFSGIIDQVYQSKGLTIVRDRKTALTELKYTYDKVKFNQQLLIYVPYVEEKLGLKVDAIEIDEVRLDELQPVPLLKNGKPSKDKSKLSLVPYEAYYNKLAEMCLEDEKEYKGILEWLEKRGHPLFNRVRVQLLDDRILNSNAQDVLDLYGTIKQNPSCQYRARSILCGYCPFKELCDLDMENPDEDIRNAVLEKLAKELV